VRRAAGIACRSLLVLAALGGAVAGLARGEQAQRGRLILTLDGGISPLSLPRERPAPVTVRLEGGLRTDDRSQLPRVVKVEIGLPADGIISTRGLPLCSQRQLRDARTPKALANCGEALVGRGRMEADVLLPGQAPFSIEAQLLLFNGRFASGERAVLVHAYAGRPPTSVVVPFAIERRQGRFGIALVAHLPPALGPWPHFARFEMTISRRYVYRGRSRSFISASCPIPPRFTAGFLSLARSTYAFADGRSVSVDIVRGCRGL
jgi:hypothetical protein